MGNNGPLFALYRRSSISYTARIYPAIPRWLKRHGYELIATCSHHEYARLRHGGSLIIVYRSGAVVVQGTERAAALALLDQLVIEGAAA